jgi:hypothetical protein
LKIWSNKITDEQDINSTENVANVHEPTDSITDDATSINSSVKQNDASIETTKEDEEISRLKPFKMVGDA